jgi:peptidoglycan/xylan/chitin deacetylase (PgdA/CDA1 family)
VNTLPGWQAAALRTTATILTATPGTRALLVLIYHRVLAEPDPLLADEPDARAFAAQMDLVARLFNVVDLVEGVKKLRDGNLPPRALAITFDDGYANNLQVAAPLLKARGLPATVFVSTGFTRGGCMWNDLVIESMRRAPATLDLQELGLGVLQLTDMAARRRAIDTVLGHIKYLDIDARFDHAAAIAHRAGIGAVNDMMMTEAQLRQLADGGIAIGAHCVRHPILARTADADAAQEIARSKQELERITGRSVEAFAYPNGRPNQDYAARHVTMVRNAGFSVAVSTAWGAAVPGSDPLQIPRVAPWDRSALKYGARLVRALTERKARKA